jgi:hypothetical protein
MVPAKRSPVDQISGQHDPQIIPASLPGAGNLLLFDDRGEAGYPPAKLNVVTRGSRVLEIDPAQKQIWEYSGATSTRRSGRFTALSSVTSGGFPTETRSSTGA